MRTIGRGNWHRAKSKKLTDDFLRLNINDLIKCPALIAGCVGVIRWNSIHQTIHSAPSLSFSVARDFAEFEISYFTNSEKHVVQRIPLAVTKSTFGNRRWFLCPGKSNQARCQRRCAMLYFRDGSFACRICHQLVYQSQREFRLSRYLSAFNAEELP